MKKIIVILSSLIIIAAIIGFVIIKDKNTAPKTEEQKQTQTPKKEETKAEVESKPEVVEEGSSLNGEALKENKNKKKK